MQMTPPDLLFTGNFVAVPTAVPAAGNAPQSPAPAFDTLMTQQMAERAAPETERPAPLAEKAVGDDRSSPPDTVADKAPEKTASATDTAKTSPGNADTGKSDAGKTDIGTSEMGQSVADKPAAPKATGDAASKNPDMKSPAKSITGPHKDLKSSDADKTKADEGDIAPAPVIAQPVAQSNVQPSVQPSVQADVPADAETLVAMVQGALAAAAPRSADAKGALEGEGVATDARAPEIKGRAAPALAAPSMSRPAAPKLAPLAAPDSAKADAEEPAPAADEVFASLLGKAVKGAGKSTGGETQDDTATDKDSKVGPARTEPSQTQTGAAEPKAAEAKVKSVLDAFQAAMQPGTGQAEASAGRGDVAAAQSQPATPVADATTSTAFSLQSLQDTSGSYSATGSSTTAASNMSKAAVETLSALSMQISKRLSEGNTKFAIELHPADLGKVEVMLNIARDGKTTAHLRFDTPITAATFSSQEGELRQQLAQTGLSFDKDSLSFSSRDGEAGFGASLSDQQGQSQSQFQSQAQARHAARALEAAGKAADETDINAALDTALANFRNRSSQSLALNLIV